MAAQHKLRIGIIGAGNIGGTLTRRLRALGHDVAVANSRARVARRAGRRHRGDRRHGHRGSAGPGRGHRDHPPEEHPRPARRPLRRGAGYSGRRGHRQLLPAQRDGRIKEIEDGLTESRWVEQQLGHPVLKAFDNIQAQHLMERGRPAGTPGRIALPVAGDDPAAKAVVLRLIDELGFDGVDAGGLDESWRQQPDTPVYGTNHDAEGVRRALSEANPQRKPEWRATANSPGGFDSPA